MIRTFRPTSPPSVFVSRATAGLALLAAGIAACSGGGGSSTEPPVNNACPGSVSTTLAGTWQVTGTLVELDPEIGGSYTPIGLEDSSLTLQFFGAETEPGPNDTSICSAAYFASGAGLDTTSPTGGPTTLGTVAADGVPNWPANAFAAVGLYYFPAGNVSVEIGVGTAPVVLSESSFEILTEFRAYEGDRIVSAVFDEPEVDDDGDGQVDEPDEADPEDAIDPEALPSFGGVIRLRFVRGSGIQASSEGSPRVAVPGLFVAADGASPCEALATLLPARGLVVWEVRDVLVAGGRVRLAGEIQPDGRFEAGVEARGLRLELRGQVEGDLVPECELLWSGGGRERSFHFEPGLERPWR